MQCCLLVNMVNQLDKACIPSSTENIKNLVRLIKWKPNIKANDILSEHCILCLIKTYGSTDQFAGVVQLTITMGPF